MSKKEQLLKAMKAIKEDLKKDLSVSEVVELCELLNELSKQYCDLVMNDNKEDLKDDEMILVYPVASKIKLVDFLSYMDSAQRIKVWYENVLIFNCSLDLLYIILTEFSKQFLDYYVLNFGTCYNENEDYSYLNISLTK